MLNKIKQQKQEGFTIIEVLIVLAIAGLIMLVVFLAVPNLQRNSRNTQRKNDVSSMLGAVQEYINNSGGTMPTQPTDFSGNFKAGFYDTTNKLYVAANPATYTATVVASTATTSTANVSTESVTVVTGYKCTSATASPTKSSVRSIAVVYVVEANSGNGQLQCQSS